jgi:septum formation protein
LASSSPRRSELLAAAGFAFETTSPGIAERADGHLTLREITMFNAARKGLSVARHQPDKVVLAADTLIALDGEIVGKPRDLKDAKRILHRLAGRTHDVCSSVFISHLAGAKSIMFHEISQVRFRKLNEATIADYLAKINALDKAGAYAAQGDGSDIIAAIAGSFTNVVGLPMEQTREVLAEFGIEPRQPNEFRPVLSAG